MRVQSLSGFNLSRYAVREDGLIFNTVRLEWCKPFISPLGYYRVALMSDDDEIKKYQLHRLVAWAFCGGYSEELVVNHKDSNPANNSPDNLEWVTLRQNTQHTIDAGRFKFTPQAKKLNSDEIHFIKTSGIGLKQLSEMFNVSKSAILYHRNTGKFVKEV